MLQIPWAHTALVVADVAPAATLFAACAVTVLADDAPATTLFAACAVTVLADDAPAATLFAACAVTVATAPLAVACRGTAPCAPQEGALSRPSRQHTGLLNPKPQI